MMSDIDKLQDTMQSDGQMRAGAAAPSATETTADAMRRDARAIQQSRRVAGDAVPPSLDTTADATRQSIEAATEALRRADEGATQTLRQSPQGVAESGLRDAQHVMARFVVGIVQTNLRATEELFRLARPMTIVELQQRFASEYLGVVMQGTVTLVHAIRRTTDEALRPLQEQVERNRQAQSHEQRNRKGAG